MVVCSSDVVPSCAKSRYIFAEVHESTKLFTSFISSYFFFFKVYLKGDTLIDTNVLKMALLTKAFSRKSTIFILGCTFCVLSLIPPGSTAESAQEEQGRQSRGKKNLSINQSQLQLSANLINKTACVEGC